MHIERDLMVWYMFRHWGSNVHVFGQTLTFPEVGRRYPRAFQISDWGTCVVYHRSPRISQISEYRMVHVVQSVVVYHRSPRISQRSLGAGQHSWSVGAVAIRWIPIIVFIHSNVFATLVGPTLRRHYANKQHKIYPIGFKYFDIFKRFVFSSYESNSSLCNVETSTDLDGLYCGWMDFDAFLFFYSSTEMLRNPNWSWWTSISISIGVSSEDLRSGVETLYGGAPSAQCDISVMPVGGSLRGHSSKRSHTTPHLDLPSYLPWLYHLTFLKVPNEYIFLTSSIW